MKTEDEFVKEIADLVAKNLSRILHPKPVQRANALTAALFEKGVKGDDWVPIRTKVRAEMTRRSKERKAAVQAERELQARQKLA